MNYDTSISKSNPDKNSDIIVNETENQFRIKLWSYCFESLISRLVDSEEPELSLTEDENIQYPIFVYWLSGELELLRGSSGTFEYEDLSRLK